MAKRIREVDGTDDVTLEEIHDAASQLKRAVVAREGAALVLKAAKETEAAARALLELLTGAREEERPLLDGSEDSKN